MMIPEIGNDAENLSAALAYAANGIYVLPVARGTKNPGSRVGKVWQDKSSTDAETIIAWYAGTDDGIAIDIGRSGLIVIDVDHPELMPDWLTRLIHTAKPPMQQTRPSVPDRGHYIFAQPPGRRIGCGRGKLTGMGLDIKGAGGVIIAAPTQHPEPDGHYRWLVTGEIPILPFPLTEMLSDTAQADSAATDNEVAEYIAAHTGNADPRIMSSWTRKFKREAAKGNSRHDSMVAILPAALEEAKAGYYPARDVTDLLREVFTQAMIDPPSQQDTRKLSEAAAYAEFQGILGWAVAQAASTPVAKTREKTERNVGRDFSFALPSPAQPPTPAVDSPAAVDSAPAGPAPDPIVNGHKRVHLSLASDIKSSVPIWAWEYNGRGRIQRGTLAILAGRPGAGKSNAARWFAAGYSTGAIEGCFYGQPVNVAYIAPGEESHAFVIKPGLDAVGADVSRICFPTMRDEDGAPTRLLGAPHRDWLIEAFRTASIRVVIVDPIMSTIPGTTDINRNNETRAHVEPWAQIADAIDGIVLGVAHFTKFPGSDLVAAINGSSAFGEVARAIFGFVKEKRTGERVLSQVKNSTGLEDLSLRYEIQTAYVPTDLGGEASVATFAIVGTSELSAADVMAADEEGMFDLGGPGFAQHWLYETLKGQSGGRMRAKEVCAKAKADEDISRATLYRAKKRLGVIAESEGNPPKAFWRLPTLEDQADVT